MPASPGRGPVPPGSRPARCEGVPVPAGTLPHRAGPSGLPGRAPSRSNSLVAGCRAVPGWPVR